MIKFPRFLDVTRVRELKKFIFVFSSRLNSLDLFSSFFLKKRLKTYLFFFMLASFLDDRLIDKSLFFCHFVVFEIRNRQCLGFIGVQYHLTFVNSFLYPVFCIT